MKIAVIGGAGAMACITIQDLSECSDVEEILVADYHERKAKEYAASFQDSRIKGSFVDAYKIKEAANLMKGYDAVINSAQYYVNISVMKACLEAGCHYNDLGGMFHTTRKQLELFDDFKKAGLTAVLGIGSAPGITNVLASYAYQRLDEVEVVHLATAAVDLTDMKGIDVFAPPYSIRTIMEEYSDKPVEFIDGEYRTLPPLSGAEEIAFPEPIGRRTCIHTLHSEPATIPTSFKDKGVKEVIWKLGLPPEFHERVRFLASIGFAGKEPIKVQRVEVVPVEVLAAVVDGQVKEKLEGVERKFKGVKCIRAQVIGKKNGRRVEYVVDCIVEAHSRWGELCSTGVPPSIIAQMQAKGIVQEPGVWAPEQVIDPEYFFKELAKREMHVQVTIKEDLS